MRQFGSDIVGQVKVKVCKICALKVGYIHSFSELYITDSFTTINNCKYKK